MERYPSPYLIPKKRNWRAAQKRKQRDADNLEEFCQTNIRDLRSDRCTDLAGSIIRVSRGLVIYEDQGSHDQDAHTEHPQVEKIRHISSRMLPYHERGILMRKTIEQLALTVFDTKQLDRNSEIRESLTLKEVKNAVIDKCPSLAKQTGHVAISGIDEFGNMGNGSADIFVGLRFTRQGRGDVLWDEHNALDEVVASRPLDVQKREHTPHVSLIQLKAEERSSGYNAMSDPRYSKPIRELSEAAQTSGLISIQFAPATIQISDK